MIKAKVQMKIASVFALLITDPHIASALPK